MAPPTVTERITKLEEKLEVQRKDDMITVVAIEKEDLLNKEIKAYENNIKITGLIHDIKESKGLNDAAKRKWRSSILKRALVDTNVVAESEIFEKTTTGEVLIRGIVRDVHPLRQRNNAAIVVAFTESWFANMVKEKIRKDEGLKMKKGREQLRIYAHLPLIIDTLQNEALRARREMIDASNGARKIHCNVSMAHPWISLVEVVGDTKKSLSFKVEDGRLVDPARCLAILALNKIKRYTPYRFLTATQKAGIASNVMTVAMPIPAHNQDIQMTE